MTNDQIKKTLAYLGVSPEGSRKIHFVGQLFQHLFPERSDAEQTELVRDYCDAEAGNELDKVIDEGTELASQLATCIDEVG